MRELNLTALAGFPEVQAGDSLPALVQQALDRTGKRLASGDILVVAQKIVSKAEGRRVLLADVQPSARAHALAAQAQKDPRLMELVLSEAREVLRVKPGVVIVEHRLGFVMANAGIDQSNLAPGGPESALLLPLDPDGSAARMRETLAAACGCHIGVIVNELVLNAMKYAYPDEKGPIRIGLKRVNGQHAMLSVEDDGIGHNIRTLPRSTGLGRSIVGAMASRLGADVVYDPAHSGTRVVITFECAPHGPVAA